MFKMFTRAIVVSAGSAMVLAFAAGTLALDDDNDKLEDLVVTATRYSESLPASLASVSTLDRSQIEQMQVSSLSELLSRISGINISRSGGAGANTGVFIRGAESNHTLILIDGVRTNSATIGSTALHHLSLDQIERIELVRGPRSSLYGSDAIGGVIQIFTRKGGSNEGATLTVGAGSHNTQQLSASATLGADDTRLNLSAAYFDTQGFSHRREEEVSAPDDDDDAYRNSSASMSLAHRFNPDNLFSISVSHNQGEAEYDGWSLLYNEFVLSSASAALESKLTDAWKSTLRLGYFIDESNEKSDEPGYLYGSETETERRSLSWQHDVSLAERQLLVVGADYYRDEVDSTIQYSEDSVDDLGVFVQYRVGIAAWDFSAGLRHDDHEGFGSHRTGNLAAGWQLTEHYRLIASYGTAFKAPSLNDLYYDVPFAGRGNPDLEPEESASSELELRVSDSWVDYWSVSVFRSDIDDLIVWESDPITYFATPRNLRDVQILGADLRIEQALGKFTLRLDYSYLDTEDKASGRPLARRAEHTANLDLDYRSGSWRLGASLLGQSERFDYDFYGNQYRLAGYATLALRASYRFSEALSLQLRVDNAFDRDYTLANGYNTDGRNVLGSVSYGF